MPICKGVRNACAGTEMVRLYCKANPNYHVAVREFVGSGPCIVSEDPEDDSTIWVKDDKMAYAFDLEGGFSLVHKETKQALKTPATAGNQMLLAPYNPAGKLDTSIIWYMSGPKAGGYHTIYNDPKDDSIVMHALRCMKCDRMEPCPEGEGRIKENTLLSVLPNKTGKDGVPDVAVNQLWRMIPAKKGCM